MTEASSLPFHVLCGMLNGRRVDRNVGLSYHVFLPFHVLCGMPKMVGEQAKYEHVIPCVPYLTRAVVGGESGGNKSLALKCAGALLWCPKALPAASGVWLDCKIRA